MLTTAVLLPAIFLHDDGQETICTTTPNSTAINKFPEYMDFLLSKDFFTSSQPTIKRCMQLMDNRHAKSTR